MKSHAMTLVERAAFIRHRDIMLSILYFRVRKIRKRRLYRAIFRSVGRFVAFDRVQVVNLTIDERQACNHSFDGARPTPIYQYILPHLPLLLLHLPILLPLLLLLLIYLILQLLTFFDPPGIGVPKEKKNLKEIRKRNC